VNFVFSYFSGFRNRQSLGSAAAEALTAVGIGIVLSALILALIGELSSQGSLDEAAGKIVVEAAVVSVGVSFANSQIEGRSRTGDDPPGDEADPQQVARSGRDEQPEDPERLQLSQDLRDLGASVAGSTVFALNIVPTEEVLEIATRLSPGHQLLLLAVSVLLCYVILFASGFEEHGVHVPSVFQHPLAETLVASAVSLAVAFVLLWLLGQREALSSPSTVIASTITLGLPAIIGGAAGRLIV
jgi:putative integral membrane protein (TIGR02587 family)